MVPSRRHEGRSLQVTDEPVVGNQGIAHVVFPSR